MVKIAKGHSLQPFSSLDIGLNILISAALITIWNIGDFNTFHHADNLIYSLISLYRWTVFVWEYDHGGTLLPLVLSFIHRPYLNLLALSTLCSFALLTGVALWASLLSFRKMTLAESSVWASLILPMAIPKGRLFDNAAHATTFGISLFFAALYAGALVCYLQSADRRRRRPLAAGLFVLGFSAIYLAKNIVVPLAVVTLGLIWERARSSGGVEARSPDEFEDDDGGLPFPLNIPLADAVPLLCLALVLLVYQLLEAGAAARTDFTFSTPNIPIALPRLFKNWVDQELTTPILVFLPVLLALYRPASWHRKNPLLAYLALGVALEVLVVSSSRWVVPNWFAGYYLTDLSFLIILVLVVFGSDWAHEKASPRSYRVLLAGIAAASLLVNMREWNALKPTWPFAAMDRTIGADTPTLVAVGCDILAGDYWKVWPAVMAANDYYYRERIVDPRTGQPRLLAGIAPRARPTEYLWRPRLDRPELRLCGFDGDDAGFRWALATYAPEIALQTVARGRLGQVVVYEVRKTSFDTVGLDFGQPVPGSGWSFVEKNPAGETFQWTNATESTLFLPLANDRDLTVEFRVIYAMAPDILRGLTLSANDQPIPLTSWTDAHRAAIFRGTIPRAALDRNHRITRLTFRTNRTLVPQLVIPGSPDTRSLGLAFDWLQVESAGE